MTAYSQFSGYQIFLEHAGIIFGVVWSVWKSLSQKKRIKWWLPFMERTITLF